MKRISLTVLYMTAILSLMTSCGPANRLTKGDRYAGMYDEKPVVLAVMPPINNSTMAEAKELLYTSISKPLIEAGYYVLSPNLLMDMFKSESAYDSELFINGNLEIFGKVLGADAVVFSIIDEWTKRGAGIQTTIRYMIKSTRTNETIFDRKCELYLSLSVNSGSGGMLGALIDLTATAINTAVTDHFVEERKCNAFIFRDIPHGKYSPDYLTDMDTVAEPEEIKATVK